MATAAADQGDINGILDDNTSQAPSPANCQYYFSPGVYIKDGIEFRLYREWLNLPHPEIHLTSHLDASLSQPRRRAPDLAAEVAATITPEQEKRFGLFAESMDIYSAKNKLKLFRDDMVEIHGVLEAMKENELADFNPADFKRMEKEDRDYFEGKKREEPKE